MIVLWDRCVISPTVIQADSPQLETTFVPKLPSRRIHLLQIDDNKIKDNARKATRSFFSLPAACRLFSRGVIFTHARVSLALLSTRSLRSFYPLSGSINAPFFKASQSYTERREVETRICAATLAHSVWTNNKIHEWKLNLQYTGVYITNFLKKF